MLRQTFSSTLNRLRCCLADSRGKRFLSGSGRLYSEVPFSQGGFKQEYLRNVVSTKHFSMVKCELHFLYS